MTIAIAITATVVTGLLVGVELAVAVVVNPMLRGLEPAAAIAGRAHGARMLGRAMPVWYIASLALVVVLAIARWGTIGAWLAVGSAALLVASVVLSIALLVPINARSATWTADEHPADWRDQQRRWDRLHTGRVAIIVLAFGLVASAVAVV